MFKDVPVILVVNPNLSINLLRQICLSIFFKTKFFTIIYLARASTVYVSVKDINSGQSAQLQTWVKIFHFQGHSDPYAKMQSRTS